MNTFHDELLKINRGNAYHMPKDDGYQHKISSLDPPKFEPNNRFGKDSTLYKIAKSSGASLGFSNMLSGMKLLKDTKIGNAAPGLNLLTGSYDALNEDNPTHDRLAGGARAASGITGLLGYIGAIPKAGALASASVSKGAFASSGALASGSSALASGGAVLGAGAAGYGVGKLINLLVGGVTHATGIGDELDKRNNIRRKSQENNGYDLSALGSEGLLALDRLLTNDNKDGDLDYKNTIGYTIAEMMSKHKGSKKEKETKELT